jgi:8-oxo-dGTP pyrophosphatase MutT (NUDIX family)
MDENETPERTALRELEEETGYIGREVIDVSAILASDPGQGIRSTDCDRDFLILFQG